ncbi:MAG: helix-turn-helix transcriptional regulator [Eubacteriales bacterium]|nr:helix-turn-helix transcriptional regulator [Eubacteriales bacterium]
MENTDYTIEAEGRQILVEQQKNQTAKYIVGQLIMERKKQGLTQQNIADATGMKTPNVTRFESCKYTPSLDVLMKYANALGKKISIELVDM